jgi:hypothetical protein
MEVKGITDVRAVWIGERTKSCPYFLAQLAGLVRKMCQRHVQFAEKYALHWTNI